MAHCNECLDLSFNDSISKALTNLSLVGRLSSLKTINNKAIIFVLQNTWNLYSNVHIKALESNLISCTFRRVEDRDRIEVVGPWFIKGALLNLKRWSPDLTLDEVSFAHCIFLVQIHNLPLIGETRRICISLVATSVNSFVVMKSLLIGIFSVL